MGAYTLENLRYTGFEYITAPRFVNVMWAKISQWLEVNRDRLLILFGVLLVGILCFEAGLLHGKATQSKPLVLSVPALSETVISQEGSNPSLKKESVAPASGVETISAKIGGTSTCVFVGSKNSNKYHAQECAVVKRIKPENRVCFSSKEEAEQWGYVASCLK